MIKRYGLGRKALSSLADTSVYGPEIVEMPNGEFYRCADIDPLLESIGAGGVSSKSAKTIEQHRAEFEAFCGKHGLSTKQDMSTGSGLFNSHVVGWMWKAWQAAKGIKG